MESEVENKDRSAWTRIRDILENPERLVEESDGSIRAIIDELTHLVTRLRSGGRSSSVVGLAVVLWHVRARWARIGVDFEGLFTTAFRISLDPSFVQPEWAIVLCGVLIHGSEQWLERERKQAVHGQIRADLGYLRRGIGVTDSVRDVAGTLLNCWESGFPDGLTPVAQACLQSWPELGDVATLAPTRFRDELNQVGKEFPAIMGSLTERHRQLYRRALEEEGIWGTLQGVSLQ